jgi:hypothetical protein
MLYKKIKNCLQCILIGIAIWSLSQCLLGAWMSFLIFCIALVYFSGVLGLPSVIHHSVAFTTLHSLRLYPYTRPDPINPLPWPKPMCASHHDLRVGVTESSLTSVTMATANASSPCCPDTTPWGRLPFSISLKQLIVGFCIVSCLHSLMWHNVCWAKNTKDFFIVINGSYLDASNYLVRDGRSLNYTVCIKIYIQSE